MPKRITLFFLSLCLSFAVASGAFAEDSRLSEDVQTILDAWGAKDAKELEENILTHWNDSFTSSQRSARLRGLSVCPVHMERKSTAQGNCGIGRCRICGSSG